MAERTNNTHSGRSQVCEFTPPLPRAVGRFAVDVAGEVGKAGVAEVWRIAACDNGAAVATTVVCSRCDEEKPALDAAPMGGAMGQRVLEGVCAECWAEWREASPRVINHYGLVLGNPEHRAQLRVAMLEFLGLDEEEEER